MSKRCDLTGVGAQTGHKVSHSNHKTKRRFVPNLQNVSFLSAILKKNISLRVTPATLRTVDHNGGIDSYLLNTSNLKLTTIAKKLKRKMKKALETSKVETKEADKPAKKAVKKPASKRPIKKTAAEKAAKKTVIKKKVKAKSATPKKSAEKKAPAKKAVAKKAAPKKKAK